MKKEKTNRKMSDLNHIKDYKKYEWNNHINETTSSINLDNRKDKNIHPTDILH